MARKKSYIYRVLIGCNGKTEIDIFMYARNADVAISFCKQKYRDKKYNYYQAIKVGQCLELQETQIVKEYLAEKLRNSIASQSDKYSEREVEAPKFITKEEAGELL